MNKPSFSVIIPTYNRKNFIEKCVNSVISQSYDDFEIIIIDDNSTDGTNDLIKNIKDTRLQYLYNDKNMGVSKSRNLGIRLAKKEFIAFLDSDDWWDPKKLETTVKFINQFPDIKIFHTEEIWFKNGRVLPQKKKHKKPDGFVYPNALELCCISISTAVIHNSIFHTIGNFDETLPACEDYDFWLRLTNKFNIKLIPCALTFKDGGRCDQLSHNIWGLDRFRIKALEKMLLQNSLTPKSYKLTLEELEKKCAVFSNGAHKRDKIEESILYKNLPKKYIPPQKIA
ncbi:family 2 glycosyl transferase [Candidatus Omnitrophus magneticus]|uniref:Family 2 glycosyl transferase n=1 Tax=Candidatus Omnitrophus magneticus TaxID=1609969 RepID=A0A0F0CSS5_9BACT|nr:family 2 glycosyl transferase [Candidatus Omnitrophus magneticus]